LRHIAGTVHFTIVVNSNFDVNLSSHPTEAAQLAPLIFIFARVHLSVRRRERHSGNHQMVLLTVRRVSSQDNFMNFHTFAFNAWSEKRERLLGMIRTSARDMGAKEMCESKLTV
jgi:hypothetical protein